MATVRRTDEGLAITSRGVAMAVGILTIIGSLVTVTAATVGARQQLAMATPVARHDSLVGAVRQLAARHDSLSRKLIALACYQAKYPVGFCDDVPRVMQAGKP